MARPRKVEGQGQESKKDLPPALAAAIDSINKKFGQGSIMVLGQEIGRAHV